MTQLEGTAQNVLEGYINSKQQDSGDSLSVSGSHTEVTKNEVSLSIS